LTRDPAGGCKTSAKAGLTRPARRAGTTAVFTVVDAALFRPLLLDPDERLVMISVESPGRSRRLSPDEIEAVRDRISIVLAAAVPARRASRVDPIVSLRSA
jgi:hypothetical protein